MEQEIERFPKGFCHIRRFSDWEDFVSRAEQILRGRSGLHYGGMPCSSLRHGFKEWSGTTSLEEAIRVARNGWPEGKMRVYTLLQQITLGGRQVPAGVLLEGGGVLVQTLHRDVLQESSGQIAQRCDGSKRTVPIRLLIHQGFTCDISSKAVIRRGAGLLLVLGALRALGHSVEVTVACACESDWVNGAQTRYEFYVPVGSNQGSVDFNALAFAVMHPAFIRRLYFAIGECEDSDIRESMGFMQEGQYGAITVDPSFPPDCDLSIGYEDGRVGSDAEVLPFALNVLRALGIEIRTEQ